MTQPNDGGRRTRVTRPYPTFTLEDALSVARTIFEVNAGLPFDRELLAGALGTTPKSSAFTMRLNSSAAYGLTEGAYNDPDISLTALGTAAVEAGDDAGSCDAVAAAAMRPEMFARFYELFDGRRLPEGAYLRNILQRELGVRAELVEECLEIMLSNGEFAGIISGWDGGYSVRLPESRASPQAEPAQNMIATEMDTRYDAQQLSEGPSKEAPNAESTRRIFVGQVGQSGAADSIAAMLAEFGISCVNPQMPENADGVLIPREVTAAMRDSSAAVLVFCREDSSRSSRDRMIALLGASSVLFDDRVVVLAEDGARIGIEVGGFQHVEFDAERPGESSFRLLSALHKAGVINVSA